MASLRSVAARLALYIVARFGSRRVATAALVEGVFEYLGKKDGFSGFQAVMVVKAARERFCQTGLQLTRRHGVAHAFLPLAKSRPTGV